MSDAFDLMLGVFRSPARSMALRTRELPDGVLDVIRIAGGDETAIAAARASTALDDADLNVAASLLLHNMFFFDAADSYRTLGVRPDADAAQIKKHYRWLMRWLHPDRNPDNLHDVFANRVTRAWDSIRTAERRANYDLSLHTKEAGIATDVQTVDTSALLREWAGRSPVPLLSGRTVRRLPQIIVIGAGCIALAALALAAWVATLDPGHVEALLPASTGHVFPAPESPAQPSLAPLSASQPMPPVQTEPVPSTVLTAPPAQSDRPRFALAVLRPADVEAVAAAPEGAKASKRRFAAPLPPQLIGRPAGAPMPVPAAVAKPATPEKPAAPPAPLLAQHTGTSLGDAALSASDLRNFVDRFQRLYTDDDVESFLTLFSPQARGNSGGYAELAGDYRRLFGQRRLRRLNLSGLHWQVDGNRAVGNGTYDAWVCASADKPESRTRGQIMLQLTRSEDGVRITQLRHTVSE